MSRKAAYLGAALGLLACARLPAGEQAFLGDVLNERDRTLAIYAATSPDYSRAKRPNGAVPDESIVLGNGGCVRSAVRDPTIDSVTFLDVAHAVAKPMRSQGFVFSKDPLTAKILVVAYWGVTSGSAGGSPWLPSLPQVVAKGRSNFYMRAGSGTPDFGAHLELFDQFTADIDQSDRDNASLLGYSTALAQSSSTGPTHDIRRDDLLEDIRQGRYFVILLAYDFQLLRRDRSRKLLWEERFSIRERGNDFMAMLPSMAANASAYLGQDTRGLIRNFLPEGRVEIGKATEVAAGESREAPIPEVGLIADVHSIGGERPEPTPRPIPAALAQRIAAYNRNSQAFRNALSARIKGLPPGEALRRAIDNFNADNESLVAKLDTDAERIREDLASVSAGGAPGEGQPSVDTLIRQFDQGLGRAQPEEPQGTQP